eukprot:scaffold196126_cov54-Attheya_sp.AAC.4
MSPRQAERIGSPAVFYYYYGVLFVLAITTGLILAMVGWAGGGSATIASWQQGVVVRPYAYNEDVPVPIRRNDQVLANANNNHIQESLRNTKMSRDLMEDSSSLNQDEPHASSFTDSSVEDGLERLDNEADASSELDASDLEETSSNEGSSDSEEESSLVKEKEEEQLVEEEEHKEELLAESLAVGSQEHNHMLDYDELKLEKSNKRPTTTTSSSPIEHEETVVDDTLTCSPNAQTGVYGRTSDLEITIDYQFQLSIRRPLNNGTGTMIQPRSHTTGTTTTTTTTTGSMEHEDEETWNKAHKFVEHKAAAVLLHLLFPDECSTQTRKTRIPRTRTRARGLAPQVTGTSTTGGVVGMYPHASSSMVLQEGTSHMT